MQKLVILTALLAVTAAAPQFPMNPFFNPYSFSPFGFGGGVGPYFRNPVSPSVVPVPYPYPYYPYFPVSAPFVPVYNAPQHQPAIPQQTPVAPPPSSQVTPASSPSTAQPKRPIPSYSNNEELTEEVAKLYLTPEQQIIFDAAVAAMNPLEYAAHLDSLQQGKHHK